MPGTAKERWRAYLESMNTWTFAAALLLTAAAFLVVSGFFRTLWKYRGKRVVVCPETDLPAAVDVDALHAAQWQAVMGEPDLRLKACSRWPERAGCGQVCLAQIESAADGCLARSMVTSWYDGKSCAFCRHPIEAIVWHERPPGVVDAEGRTRLWKETPVEELPGLFATGRPVCWRCHIVESFRREYPELVVERHRPPEAPHRTIPPSAAFLNESGSGRSRDAADHRSI